MTTPHAKVPDPAASTAPTEEELAADLPSVDAAESELVAGSLGEYTRAWWKRVRGGESGVLPVLLGLVIIIVVFQTQQSVFLSAGNLTNLLVQGANFVLLSMAEVFVLLLGEINLSVGFVGGIGAVVTVISPQVPGICRGRCRRVRRTGADV